MILFKIQPTHHNQEESKHPKEVYPKEALHQVAENRLKHIKIVDDKKTAHN
jgi:hypothetical protein